MATNTASGPGLLSLPAEILRMIVHEFDDNIQDESSDAWETTLGKDLLSLLQSNSALRRHTSEYLYPYRYIKAKELVLVDNDLEVLYQKLRRHWDDEDMLISKADSPSLCEGFIEGTLPCGSLSVNAGFHPVRNILNSRPDIWMATETSSHPKDGLYSSTGDFTGSAHNSSGASRTFALLRSAESAAASFLSHLNFSACQSYLFGYPSLEDMEFEPGGGSRLQHIYTALQSLKGHLEVIELWSYELYASYEEDYELVEWRSGWTFKSFSKLKSLALTDMFLIGMSPRGLPYFTDPPKVTAEFLTTVLPPSLEYFTHIINDGPSAYDEVIGRYEREDLWDNFWHSIDVLSYFPRLREVRFSADGPKGVHTIWCRDWDLVTANLGSLDGAMEPDT
ncbi:hypothetical protein M011DRAFT_526667 [Sporormia fimetaria CBS 119925]|uniref:Uncharacterized protein n=1 Tax=Sporormia fimetaria CBS 119925 TaxID=1340428 RepID=A0A6A6VA27_9PLEO|nr:hypothetical protein M011DRAFT_526667 [Sporormia fimetaria CBS 119925]